MRADVKRIEDLTKEVRKIHSAILSAPVIDQSEFTACINHFLAINVSCIFILLQKFDCSSKKRWLLLKK